MAQLNPAAIEVSDSQATRLISMAEQASPHEICGMITGKSGIVEQIIPISNRSPSRNKFQMDPKEQIAAFYQIEKRGLELIAFYHSHPLSSPFPSPTDLAEWNYPEVPQVIIGKESEQWKINAFRLEGKNILQIKINISQSQQPI
jgi:proteasome lid subunit RPN8/RPN11